jgi:hypothetical protein
MEEPPNALFNTESVVNKTSSDVPGALSIVQEDKERTMELGSSSMVQEDKETSIVQEGKETSIVQEDEETNMELVPQAWCKKM